MTDENLDNDTPETPETPETPSDSLLDIDGDDAIDFSSGKPEGFPDDLWDAEANTPKVDMLYQRMQEAENRAKGLRDKLAKGAGKAPKDAAEYEFFVPDDLKDFIPDNDPVLEKARAVAFKSGMPKELAEAFIGEMIAEIGQMRSEAGPQEPTEEEKAEYRKAEFAKIGANAQQVVRAVAAWGNELYQTGQFSESELQAFKDMAFTGEAVKVMNKLRALAGGGKTIPTTPTDDGLPSDSEIVDMLSKAYKAGDITEIGKVEKLLDKRREAGRPERLAI